MKEEAWGALESQRETFPVILAALKGQRHWTAGEKTLSWGKSCKISLWLAHAERRFFLLHPGGWFGKCKQSSKMRLPPRQKIQLQNQKLPLQKEQEHCCSLTTPGVLAG